MSWLNTAVMGEPQGRACPRGLQVRLLITRVSFNLNLQCLLQFLHFPQADLIFQVFSIGSIGSHNRSIQPRYLIYSRICYLKRTIKPNLKSSSFPSGKFVGTKRSLTNHRIFISGTSLKHPKSRKRYIPDIAISDFVRRDYNIENAVYMFYSYEIKQNIQFFCIYSYSRFALLLL